MPRTANVESTANGTSPASNAESKPTRSIPVSVPVAFKEILDAKAKEQGISVTGLARNILAKYFDYTLPPTAARGPRSAYAGMTPEQKKEAIAAKQKETRDTVKALMAALKAGDINKEEIFAKFGPKPEVVESVPA